MRRQIFACLLTLYCICAMGAVSVHGAQNEEYQQPVPLTLEMGTTMTTTVLYSSVELEGHNPDMDEIWAQVFVSVDGENFVDATAWSDWEVAGGKTRRICLYPMAFPLDAYLAGEINCFFVRMRLHFADGSLRDTTTAACIRPTPGNPEEDSMEADRITVTGAYPNTVYLVDSSVLPYGAYGQYHITAAEGAEYGTLLPQTVSVVLGFRGPSDDADQATVTVEYGVRWGETPELLADGSLRYTAAALSPPEESVQFTIGDSCYRFPEEGYAVYPDVLADYPLYCTVHPVQVATASALLLSRAFDDYPLKVTLPQKPAGAGMIVTEISVDGGVTWTAAGELDLRAHPVDAVPNQPGYTAELLTAESVSRLMDANGGFLVRLQVFGGPFGNGINAGQLTYTYSQSASWPADYVYYPPKDPTQGEGGEGNRGDAGTDNSGTGGVRPGTGEGGGADTGNNTDTTPGENTGELGNTGSTEHTAPTDNTGGVTTAIPEIPTLQALPPATAAPSFTDGKLPQTPDEAEAEDVPKMAASVQLEPEVDRADDGAKPSDDSTAVAAGMEHRRAGVVPVLLGGGVGACLLVAFLLKKGLLARLAAFIAGLRP